MSSRSRVIAFCIVGLALFGAPVPSPAADTERGRGLYEESCTACHAQSVHARSKRVARDFDEVRAWVERWNGTLSLRWGDEEIEDVTAYLNATFYRYAVPVGGPRSRTPPLVSSRPAAVPE
jgi:mono/diheme cytochrome c family protein